MLTNAIHIVCLLFCRYLDKTEILDITTFLDPRVKSMPYLTSTEREIIQDRVFDLYMSEDQSSNQRPAANEDSGSGAASLSAAGSETVNTNTKPIPILSGLLSSMYEAENSSNENRSQASAEALRCAVALELKLYCSAEYAKMDQCPLNW